MDPALVKLEKTLGVEQGRELHKAILAELGIPALRDADERVRFGERLIARGGLFAALGRAIVTQAILHGASETLARIQTMRRHSSSLPPPR